MPRARRRRNRSATRRSLGRTVVTIVLVAFGLVVVVGSFAEIHAQSSGYRSSTNTGFAALATPVVESSNLTGTRLGSLVRRASTLTDSYFAPTAIQKSARAVLQQGLDQAVADTGDEAARTEQLTPPEPTGAVSGRLSAVMAERADATVQVRTAIDRMLGMTPLPVEGSTVPTTSVGASPLISADQAAAALGAAGRLFEQSDGQYRALASVARAQATPMHLPPSAWVPRPVRTAPLGATELAGAAGALSASAALQPDHRLLVTSVGLDPPAVATGGQGVVPGTAGNSCGDPQSTVPSATPTVLPPTSTITALVTVTNCGNVDESGVRVTQALVLADPPGTSSPPSSASGGRAQAIVSVAAGASVTVSLPPATVASGHLYTLTLTVVTVVSTGAPLPGATQQFLVKVAP